MKNRDEIKQQIKSMSEDELVDLYIKSKENEAQMKWYREQLILLNKNRYSSKSEKEFSGQLNLFNEVEDIYDHNEETNDDVNNKDEAENKQHGEKGKPKKKKEADFSRLPKRIIEHPLENEYCEICGTKLKELAPTIIDVLKYQPARFYIERHIIHNGICPTCTDENLEAEIIVAPGAPKRLIKGSKVSSSVVSGIIFEKYVNGTPLYRQEQELKRKKIEISRGTMSNWLMNCARQLEPLYDLMLEKLRSQEMIHADETTLTVLEDKKESDRQKSYMWLIASGIYEEEKLVYYSYHESREHDHIKELLGEDAKNGVHSDGYDAYHKLSGITNYGCVAHMRRKFKEALEVNPMHKEGKKLSGKALEEFCKVHESYGIVRHIIDEIKRLYKEEKDYKEKKYDPEMIKKERQEVQKPILDDLFEYIEEHQNEFSEKSKMGVAMTYALNQKEYLKNYLTNGKAEIDNNRGERFIKPFVIGRKNWLFSKTKSGAKMSAIYYSIIESAKENHLDIYGYLGYILEEIQEQEEDVDYEQLLPCNPGLPEKLKVK